MYRFVRELERPDFNAAHPVVQAAFAHYAFVWIHPFADGTGRVARALASVYTCRSHSMPLMILAENRPDYLQALAAADAGDLQAFVDFVFDRVVEGILLAKVSLTATQVPSVETPWLRFGGCTWQRIHSG
jgi:Fic family protein